MCSVIGIWKEYIYIYISDFDIERYRVRWDSHIIVFSTLF